MREKGFTKKQDETLGQGKYAHHLDYNGDFTSTDIYQNLSDYTL